MHLNALPPHPTLLYYTVMLAATVFFAGAGSITPLYPPEASISLISSAVFSIISRQEKKLSLFYDWKMRWKFLILSFIRLLYTIMRLEHTEVLSLLYGSEECRSGHPIPPREK